MKKLLNKYTLIGFVISLVVYIYGYLTMPLPIGMVYSRLPKSGIPFTATPEEVLSMRHWMLGIILIGAIFFFVLGGYVKKTAEKFKSNVLGGSLIIALGSFFILFAICMIYLAS